MSIETTFISLLSGVAPLYMSEKLPNITTCIVYRLISTVPKKYVQNATAENKQRFQFQCFDVDAVGVNGLGDSVIGLLDNLEDVGDIRSSGLANKNYYKDPQTKLFVCTLDFYIS